MVTVAVVAGFLVHGDLAHAAVQVRLAATLPDETAGDVTSVAFGPGGTLDAVSQAGLGYTFSVGSQRVASVYKLADTSVGLGSAVAMPDDAAIAAPGADCTAFGPCPYLVYSLHARTWLPVPKGGFGPAFAVGRSTLAFTSVAGVSVEAWILRPSARVTDFLTPDVTPVSGIAVSPDGTALAVSTAGTEGTLKVYVWDLASRRLVASLTVRGDAGALAQPAGTPGQNGFLALGDGGGTLAVSGGQATMIYDVRSGSLISTAPGALRALSPDGALIATTDPAASGQIDLRDTATGKAVAALAAPAAGAAPVTATFSPDSHSVAVGCTNGDTYIWNLTGS